VCRSKVEVFCYALSPPDGSEWRARIEEEAEHFVDVSAWTTADVARRISADGVQLAVNLNGYTKGARNEVFALEPAPVQCSYLGFPATTGAPFLPWLILDKVRRKGRWLCCGAWGGGAGKHGWAAAYGGWWIEHAAMRKAKPAAASV
jgi:protein O-GlcNAc transferase